MFIYFSMAYTRVRQMEMKAASSGSGSGDRMVNKVETRQKVSS